MEYTNLQPTLKSKATRLLNLVAKSQELEATIKSLKSEMITEMEQINISKIIKDKQSITVVEGGKSNRLDTNKLKTLYKDIYDECIKEINTTTYLKIKA